MKKIYLIATLVLSLGITNVVNAQKTTYEFDGYHKNIYVEFLGSSLLVGGNFDMRLNRGRMDGIGFRVGIGGIQKMALTSSVDAGVVVFPLEFNHIVGSKRSGFVSGVGLLPVYTTVSGEHNGDDIQGDGLGILGGYFNIGYRLQPIKKAGFMMQVNWNPLILRSNGFSPGWVGLSLGIGFK